MTLISNIATVLTNAGLSNIKAYRFDSSSVPQICIIPGGGSVDMISSTDGGSSNDFARPTLQIQIRDSDLATAESRAHAIIALLHRSKSVSGCISVAWDGRTPDYWADDNGLHIFSIEFKIIRNAMS